MLLSRQMLRLTALHFSLLLPSLLPNVSFHRCGSDSNFCLSSLFNTYFFPFRYLVTHKGSMRKLSSSSVSRTNSDTKEILVRLFWLLIETVKCVWKSVLNKSLGFLFNVQIWVNRLLQWLFTVFLQSSYVHIKCTWSFTKTNRTILTKAYLTSSQCFLQSLLTKWKVFGKRFLDWIWS